MKKNKYRAVLWKNPKKVSRYGKAHYEEEAAEDDARKLREGNPGKLVTIEPV